MGPEWINTRDLLATAVSRHGRPGRALARIAEKRRRVEMHNLRVFGVISGSKRPGKHCGAADRETHRSGLPVGLAEYAFFQT